MSIAPSQRKVVQDRFADSNDVRFFDVNPTTSEFTTTTPALNVVGYNVFPWYNYFSNSLCYS
jgi:hypothetical protein